MQDPTVIPSRKSMGKRVLTGESLFMRPFTNRAAGKQAVAFAAPYPGKIIPLDLKDYNGELFCQPPARTPAPCWAVWAISSGIDR